MYRALLLLLFLNLNLSLVSPAQTLRKYPISTSGCSYFNYCDAKWDISHSPDSSHVYTGECNIGGIFYSAICVKLKEPAATIEEAEEQLGNYLHYLQASFDITEAAGQSKGQRLPNDPGTRGILDYWKDKDGDYWKVKGWTNGRYIGVLMAYGAKELPEQKVNAFLDGLSFPK